MTILTSPQVQTKALVLAEILENIPGNYHLSSAEELKKQHAKIVELEASLNNLGNSYSDQLLITLNLQQELKEVTANAKRYQHEKMYNLLNGWNDENLDRDISIHDAVTKFA